jgi:alkylation response protein AidB-like acyl-CoA dehydrogenase
MDFDEDDALAAYRMAAREWVERNVKEEWIIAARESASHHLAPLHAVLAREGILGAAWPTKYGGTDYQDSLAQAIFDDIEAIGLRSAAWGNTQQVMNTVLRVGTEKQKHDIISRACRGEFLCALGFSEPGCGSDAAAARTRAVLDGADWVIDGAKMFTSTAHVATHVILLTRTNRDAPKHRGLTVFLVPINATGIDIAPFETLGGERSNATFYSGVRVPDSARLGEIDGGWAVMRVTLVYERTGSRRLAGPRFSHALAEWARTEPVPGGGNLIDSELARATLARVAIDEEISRLLSMQTSWVSARGELPRAEGAIAKLYSTEQARRNQERLIDLVGLPATLHHGEAGAVLDGDVEKAFRAGVVTTIYGGASEILRDIVAELRLGLPRNRPLN